MLKRRHINGSALNELFKLFIVDVSSVKGKDISRGKLIWLKHEAVVGCRRGELYIARGSLIGMDNQMHLDAPFLFAQLGVPSHAFEYQVGKQRYRRQVDNLKAI